jgi:hypothetical protein
MYRWTISLIRRGHAIMRRDTIMLDRKHVAAVAAQLSACQTAERIDTAVGPARTQEGQVHLDTVTLSLSCTHSPVVTSWGNCCSPWVPAVCHDTTPRQRTSIRTGYRAALNSPAIVGGTVSARIAPTTRCLLLLRCPLLLPYLFIYVYYTLFFILCFSFHALKYIGAYS